MDLTLIKQANFLYNRKQKKEIISDEGIACLSDCALILLHKSGLRPLFIIDSEDKEKILLSPKEKMEKPDLILFSDTEIGKQSARTLQEQMKAIADCSTKILPINFSTIENVDNFEVLKNLLHTKAKHLEERGYKHLVVVAKPETLDKIAHCMNGTGLKNQNVPIYSFLNGKEIMDENLTSGSYMTRDIMDTMLVKRYNASGRKLSKPLSICTVKQKLHIFE